MANLKQQLIYNLKTNAQLYISSRDSILSVSTFLHVAVVSTSDEATLVSDFSLKCSVKKTLAKTCTYSTTASQESKVMD